MTKRKKKGRPPTPPKYKIGDHIRVKHGTMDADYPDMPLGGWAGTISEFHGKGMYTVRWSQETLDHIHPIFKKWCERDGMVVEEYWLGEENLEADPGGPLTIEQPTQLAPRPLRPDDQTDRVRMVFELTSEDPLPEVDGDSLETYYDHLVEQMSLPAEARHCSQLDFSNPKPMRRVTVVALDREVAWDEDDGVLCKIHTAGGEEVVPLMDLEFRRSNPNYQLVDDYSAWFVGELTEDMDDDEDGDEDGSDWDVLESLSRRNVALLLLEIIAFATSYGAVLGAAVAVMSWARWGACVGAGVAGIFMAFVQMSSAAKDMRFIVPRFRKAFAGILGLITGAIQGAFFGIMVVAFVGAALGGVTGFLVRRLLGGKKGRFFHVFPGSVLAAAACGVVAQALYMNWAVGADGLLHGALAGLAGGLFFCLIVLPLAFLTVRRPDQYGAS